MGVSSPISSRVSHSSRDSIKDKGLRGRGGVLEGNEARIGVTIETRIQDRGEAAVYVFARTSAAAL